jgi:C4-dicarboxylate transporter, DctQ subunit
VSARAEAGPLVRIYDGLLDLLAWGAVLLLLGVMTGIGIDVAARYLLNRPIAWMSEFVQHSMLLILFLSLGWLTRERGHVAVEILLDSVPERPRQALAVLAALLASAVCAFTGVWAVIATWDNHARQVLTDGIFPIPRAWLIASIAVGLLLSAIEFLASAVQMMRNPHMRVRQVDAEIASVAALPTDKT